MSRRMNLCYAGAAALLAMCAAVPAVHAHATTLAVSARGEQISMNGELAQAPVCRVVRSDANTLELAFDLRGLHVRPVKTKGGEFVAIDWPDASIDGAVGAPALPVLRQIFVAPDGADVSLGPIHLEAARFAAINQPIVPVQAPVEKLPGALENAPFAFDADAYRADSTDAVTITALGTVRGESLYMVEFRPVAYDAAAGTIAVTDQMQVRIDFKNHDTVPQRMTEMPGLDDIVINPSQLHGLRQGGAGNYLAVIASAYEAGIQGFLDVKEDQGYTVYQHVVSPGTSASAIKTYIEGLWGTADAPDYLLFVGDTDTIPAWTGGGTGSPKTDLNYACMDGPSDWYPDIAYGRFSVRSGSELADVVEKTLVVEEGPHADPGYTVRAVFMASVDNYHISEGTHNYVIDTHLDPNGFECDKLYQVTYGADTQDVRDSFNEGQIYGIYSGHGGNNSWADGPPFSKTDVNNLTNEGMYSLVWSFACVTGAYTDTECFMETWLRASDKGAAIAIGSSVNSYWTEDDVLEKVLFDIIYDTGVREVGPCWNATRMEYLAQMGSGSTTRRYFEMYNIMGDPSLFIPLPGGDLDMGVFPYSGMYAEGQSGGPFVPDEFVYTIENRLDIPCQYEVTDDASWITLANASGMIPEGGSVDVTVTINGGANMLPDGEHVGTITFTNLTTGDGSTDRDLTLKVGVPVPVYMYDLSTDPGWTTDGLWAYGSPTGGGGEYGNNDPTSGHSGPNCYGYNLSGDYENYLAEKHLTTTAIDCSNMADVSVKFWRHLNVESPTFDHAYVRVSNNGSTWTTVWENQSETTDSSWQQVEYDISDVADGQETVYLRWTMGTTDSSWQYSGWNIDDVEIWGLLGDQPCPEDLNGDGYRDLADLGIILASYGVDGGGDIDGDGDTDLADLGLLLAVYDTICP